MKRHFHSKTILNPVSNVWCIHWRYQYIAWLMEIIGIWSILIWLDFIMYFLALFGIFTCCMYSFSSIIYVRECVEQFLYFHLGKCNRWFLIQIFLSHAAEKIISRLDLINARTSVTRKDDEKKHGCMCVLNQNFITIFVIEKSFNRWLACSWQIFF